MRTLILIAASLSLSACVTGTDPTADVNDIPEREVAVDAGGTCNARMLDPFLNEYATQDLGAEMLRLSGARTLQWIPPRTQVTMDIRKDRLRVSYDDKKSINRIVCQ